MVGRVVERGRWIGLEGMSRAGRVVQRVVGLRAVVVVVVYSSADSESFPRALVL